MLKFTKGDYVRNQTEDTVKLWKVIDVQDSVVFIKSVETGTVNSFSVDEQDNWIIYDKVEVPEREEIVNPSRYTQNNIECWDFCAMYGLDNFLSQIVKYVWRHKEKGGVESLRKAQQYLNKYRSLYHQGLILYHKDFTKGVNTFCFGELHTFDVYQLTIIQQFIMLPTVTNCVCQVNQVLNNIDIALKEYIFTLEEQ